MPKEFIRFLVTGLCATTTQYVAFWALLNVALHTTMASGIGYGAGAVTSYLLNYYFTFRSNRTHNSAIIRFCMMVFVGFIVNTSIVHLFAVMLLWHPWLAQLCATLIALLCNFVLAKFVVFSSST